MTVTTKYTDWAPMVALRYNVSKALVLRSSWSNTLSRPDFTLARP